MNLAEQIISSIEKLPPFPEVVKRLMELVDDPTADAEDIFAVVQYDQALTANCLKLCNCSYFGLRQKVHSLRQAVVLLGTKNLLKIVLAGAGVNIYTKAQEGYGLQRGELWQHSVTCAILSQIVLKKMGRSEDPLLFTSSLLHDVGKVALSDYVGKEFDIISLLVQEQKMSFVEAEKEVLGIDHAELGGIISEKWQFPPLLVKAIRYHHPKDDTEDGREDEDLVPWVRLSNLIANMLGVGTGHDGMACRVDSDLLNQFSLGRKEVQEIMAEFPGEMKKAEELLKITVH